MESRFIYISNIILRFMCLLVVITLLKHSQYLNTKSFNFLRIRFNNNKYILLWSDPLNTPFANLGKGRSRFVSRKCAYSNCVVTADKNLLSDIGMFDVIVFNAAEISRLNIWDLPKRRLGHQKYVFASTESPDTYPVCTSEFDGYFNWTWTYKLDSEVRWGYIVIRNAKGAVVGPNKEMNWLDWSDMHDVSNETKERLKSKTIAVAWFVSNCITKSRREGYVIGLQKYLLEYELRVDVFGACGNQVCPRNKEEECNKMIEKDYYFYLSFENAFGEDYVTEKLLIPLQNYAIPIVYGGADYSRFLPPDSYLDARELGLYELADKIIMLIQDPEMYARYFKWKNHYSYHKTSDSPETDEYCQMCAVLNNDKEMTKTSVYQHLHEWWDSSSDSCYL